MPEPFALADAPFLLEVEYELQLFIAGASLRSEAALRNLRVLCAEHLAGRHTLVVIDLQQHPELAEADDILGVPCLVKKRPGLVGDFSQPDRVLRALGLV